MEYTVHDIVNIWYIVYSTWYMGVSKKHRPPELGVLIFRFIVSFSPFVGPLFFSSSPLQVGSVRGRQLQYSSHEAPISPFFLFMWERDGRLPTFKLPTCKGLGHRANQAQNTGPRKNLDRCWNCI